MAAHDPAVRLASAKKAAKDRWAKELDRTAATAPAREAFLAGMPSAAERSGYFKALAKRSVAVRKARRQASAQ